MEKTELPDLEVFDAGLDGLESLLEKLKPHYPSASELLENLREFREAALRVDEALGGAEDQLEDLAGKFGVSKEELDSLRETIANFLDFTDKELEEVERALGLLIALDGSSNLYASRALEKVKDVISLPLPTST